MFADFLFPSYNRIQFVICLSQVFAWKSIAINVKLEPSTVTHAITPPTVDRNQG